MFTIKLLDKTTQKSFEKTFIIKYNPVLKKCNIGAKEKMEENTNIHTILKDIENKNFDSLENENDLYYNTNILSSFLEERRK